VTVQQAFENLLEKSINLSPAQISQGSKSHTYIRNLLDNKWQTHDSFPWIVEGDFLSGSYGRGTKIWPLDDIDVMIVLDGHGLVPISGGTYLNAEVRGSGMEGSPIWRHFDANNLVSSVSVLEVFKDALKDTYPDSEIKKDGQAVNVWLASYGIGLDIVPCFHIVPRDGSQDFYYIPMGNGNTMWKSTNPKIDHRISDYLHARHDRKLKPVVKLLKYWNKTQNAERLRSYHIEALAWHIFHAHPSKIADYGTAVKYFFDNAAARLVNYCTDPTGIGGYIDLYLTLEARQQTIKKMQEAARTGVNTLSCSSIRLLTWQVGAASSGTNLANNRKCH
jgi:Second Messenger Oligonucleotide or Dinucleotide Synthetase domain